MQIKQFKLTNGEEIVCEVIQWPSEEMEEVLIKKVLKITVKEDYEKNTRYYSFKPWLVFAEDPENLTSLNPYHIVGESNPSDDLLEHFYETINMMEETLKENPSLKTFESTEEKDLLDEIMTKLNIENDTEIQDVDDSNVIKFKPKSTLH